MADNADLREQKEQLERQQRTKDMEVCSARASTFICKVIDYNLTLFSITSRKLKFAVGKKLLLASYPIWITNSGRSLASSKNWTTRMYSAGWLFSDLTLTVSALRIGSRTTNIVLSEKYGVPSHLR